LPEAGEAWVYRAVSPEAIDPISGDLNPLIFVLRANESELSVYAASVQTPRGVLQRIIDQLYEIYSAKPEPEQERYLAWMERKGTTVERRIELGWRVVRLLLSAFIERGFIIGDTAPDGHIGIYGTREQFESHARRFMQLAEFVKP